MSKLKSDELLQRIAGANRRADERITISLSRDCIPVLEKYRKRDAGDGGRSRRQSLGQVAEELILAADELLQRYAREGENPPQREADEKTAR